MASTNKTTNYELSQFLGTDKPAWLSDYNSDMGKIDAQMKLNADAATTAGGDAASAVAAVGTLANLTTDAKTSAVAAINEVDSHADAAQGTASSALSSATTANTDITALKSYLDINSFTNYASSSMAITSGGGTLRNNSNITVARNTDGTLAKIYGFIVVDNPTGSSAKVKLNVDTGLRPTEKITINGLGIIENIPQIGGLSNLSVDINIDGTIEFYGSVTASETLYIVRPFACLLFIENFGDQPE